MLVLCVCEVQEGASELDTDAVDAVTFLKRLQLSTTHQVIDRIRRGHSE